MKKNLIAVLFCLVPFLSFAQTEAQVRSNINTKLPSRGNRAEGLKAADVRSTLTDIVNYSKAKADSVKTYSILKTDSLRNYVNVKLPFATPESFGAVGNGIVDDTQALRAAIAGALYLVLDKHYKITDTLNLRPGQTLTGTGTIDLVFSTAKKGGINANSFCLINGLTINQKSTATSIVSGQDNVCILVGYYTFQTSTPTNVAIRNCKLNTYNTTQNSTLAVLGANNVLVENCKFQNFGAATLAAVNHWSMVTGTPSQGTIHPYNITYRNCEFRGYGATDNTSTSAVMSFSSISNVLLENSRFIGAPFAVVSFFPGDYGYVYATESQKKQANKNIVVRNIIAESIPKNGITIVGKAVLAPGSPVYNMDILVENSSFRNDTLSNTSNGASIQNVRNVIIRNTSFKGFYVGAYAQANAKNILLEGLKITDSGWKGVYINDATTPPEDIKVINCIIENTGSQSAAFGAGIELGNCLRPVLSGNVFGAESGTEITSYGIRIPTQANPVAATLENNFVRNIKAGGVGYSLGSSGDSTIVYKFDGNRAKTGITFRSGSTAITIDRN